VRSRHGNAALQGLSDVAELKINAGDTLHNKFGMFRHNDMIGKPFGSRVCEKKSNRNKLKRVKKMA
jgi:hypothetical protein